jgi:hypothetical protein
MGRTTLDEKIDAVVNAWLVPGPAPGFHRRSQAKLRQEWPTLANAVVELARFRRQGPKPPEQPTVFVDYALIEKQTMLKMKWGLENFKLNDDCTKIVSPGKFEGQWVYAPHYFWVVMKGDYAMAVIGADGTEYDYVEIVDGDRDIFTGLIGLSAEYMRVWETEQGFVRCEETTEADMEAHVKEAQESHERDEQYRLNRGTNGD